MRCAKHLPLSSMRQRRLRALSLTRRHVENLARRSYNFSLKMRDCAKDTNTKHNVLLPTLTHLVFPTLLLQCQVAQSYLSTPNFPSIASSKHSVPMCNPSATNYWPRTPKICSNMLMHLPSADITNHRVHLISLFSSSPSKPFSQNHFVSIRCCSRKHLRSASHWPLLHQ